MKNFKPFVFVVLLVNVIWFVSTYTFDIKEIFIPRPDKTYVTLIQLFKTNSFWIDVSASWLRVFGAFLLSFVVSYPIVIIALTSERFKNSVFLMVEFFRYLPIPVFVPLTILWFGVGNTGKIIIVFLGTFAQMIPMYYDSAMLMNNKFISFPAALKWDKKKVIRKIIIPGSAPYIFDNSRICFGWAWTYLIIAELLGAENGIGYAIIRAQRYLETDKIFAYILVIGLIGILTDRLLMFIRVRRYKWAS